MQGSGIKYRLILLNFLEFFVWGSWLISLGGYMILTLGFNGKEVGKIYATMGLASIFMPALLGIVADRWVNAERVPLWLGIFTHVTTVAWSLIMNASAYSELVFDCAIATLNEGVICT